MISLCRSFFSFLLAALLLSCAGGKKSGVQALTDSVQPLKPMTAVDSLLHPVNPPNRDIAHESFLRGLLLRNLGKDDFAEIFYKRALANEPGNRFLAFELADILSDNGKSAEALAIARQAILFQGEPSSSQFYLLARLYRENADLDSAMVYYEKTIALSPSHFRALYEYSVILEARQDYQNLLRIYGLLLPLLDYPRPMVEKEVLLLKLKGNDSTLCEFLEHAYEAHGSVEIGRQYAGALLDRKRYTDALAVGKELLQQDSSDRENWSLLVRTGLRLGMLDSATQWQKRVALLDSSDMDEWKRLAMMEFELPAMDSSLAHFRRVLQARPTDHLSWFYISNIAIIRNDTAVALDAIQRAIALKPDALPYRNHLASLYASMGNYEKAHQTLDAVLSLYPAHPLPMQYQANIYIHEAMGIEQHWPVANSPEILRARELRLHALEWLRKAYPLDSSSVDLLFDLASNYERLDSIPQACSLFEKILRLNPQSQVTLNYLGYLLVDRRLDVD
ncbi:MAG TPA: tetratricopeptide repeat protein, partial [Fibrobacteraceae bacterium]|nr:tetratricopeptide repeat protein [Fibrobacteraceae bacterium]